MQTVTPRAAREPAHGVAPRAGATGQWKGRLRRAGARGCHFRTASLFASLTLVCWLTGCASPPTSPATEPSAPSLPSPGSARAAAEQKALEVYAGMWRAYAKAGLTANPDEPDLARYAAGRALTTLTEALAGYRGEGQILKGDLITHPRVSGASPDTAPRSVTVTDCLDTTEFLVYLRSGERVDDPPGGRRSVRASVMNLGTEGWKVTSFGVQAVNTC